MKLTGKAKEDFLDYYWETKIKTLKMTICKREDLEAFFDTILESFQNAIIIEFFDSVAFWNKIFFDCYENGLGNYFETVNQAIEKANLIYNEK